MRIMRNYEIPLRDIVDLLNVYESIFESNFTKLSINTIFQFVSKWYQSSQSWSDDGEEHNEMSRWYDMDIPRNEGDAHQYKQEA